MSRAPLSSAATGDQDGDGIADTKDLCPTEPEDFDAFEDADGCPDPDNDNDGFLDRDDACPNDAGVAPNGCPAKKARVAVATESFEVREQVQFETGKATIKPASFLVLNDVATLLESQPTLRIRVECHTDN